jgi:(p)ppGpp synthase/HD superfamily hydrolase
MTANRGYSDRINHALALAAKHHDQQVRKGTQLPYLTRPASVGIILTRYGQDEDTVIAGIMHDVIEESVRQGTSLELLRERIGEKLGDVVLETALSVTERRLDDDGIEMSPDERRDDVLARLAHASVRGRWVCVADTIHSAGSLAADLKRTQFPETVWSRVSTGRDGTLQWFQSVVRRLEEVGFREPASEELRALTQDLELAASQSGAEPRKRR